MITAPTASFYILKADDEVASSIAAFFSEAAAADITRALVISRDFDSDIEATGALDGTIKVLSSELPSLQLDEKFNPLYLPTKIEKVDEVIQLESQTGGYTFTEFGGNPYVFKAVEAKREDEPILVGRVQYHPFELPAYMELVDANSEVRLN